MNDQSPLDMAVSAENMVKEDQIYFGLTITHPALNFVMLDPFADSLDDISKRRPGEEEKINWDDFDVEAGLKCRAVPFVVVNGKSFLLTEEKLQWLAVQAQGIVRALKGAPALADPTWASFRRTVRSEKPKG